MGKATGRFHAAGHHYQHLPECVRPSPFLPAGRAAWQEGEDLRDLGDAWEPGQVAIVLAALGDSS
jgi:hypothetical protein